MAAKEKSREIRFRRMAKRQGLELKKSRRRDPKAVDFGGYMLIDQRTGEPVLGKDHYPFQASLEDVEKYLTE